MAKKKKQYEDDDGRVIANMNVDGMPWYVEKARKKTDQPEGEPLELTPKEKRAYMGGILKAVMLVVLAFGLMYLVFLLLCTQVWFK